MNELKSVNLFDFSKTIARELFESAEYPWELLPKISEYIVKLGETLPSDRFDKIGENIWVAKSAKVAPTASLNGPLIIDEEAEIRHCAFIRGNAIVGKCSVVGNSTELKNCILFDCTQTPHYNYVGDSIYGYKAHTGAGVIASNLKSDKSLVTVNFRGEKVPTGVKKFGAMIGDYGDIGCNTVMNPGTVIGRGTSVYPLSFVRGYVEENSIYKKQGEVVARR
ncbi:MAG: UDP-N-acetylglucosamine pyrophosphorylase [Eubacteriales bacterium]|nr:UDP-N-acetylglucosamine pyrophosphorylase [Eubacteriales bacterium]